MNWLSVRVRPHASRELAMAALFDAGSEGVHESGDELVTHFPESADVERIRAIVMTADAQADVRVELIPATDWAQDWKKGIRAHQLGALTVAPPWLAEHLDPASSIIIEPEMAFGTGEHETTRGVIRLLPSIIRAGDRVADLGSGSAVLAIAAAKLGASHVFAIEIDHDSIANSRENVLRNRVSSSVSILEGDAAVFLPLVAPVRVILANIISSVLKELLPMMLESLGDDGAMILSGILGEEREDMLAALASVNCRVINEDAEGAWWSASVTRL